MSKLNLVKGGYIRSEFIKGREYQDYEVSKGWS
jgi:hypothetical protein